MARDSPLRRGAHERRSLSRPTVRRRSPPVPCGRMPRAAPGLMERGGSPAFGSSKKPLTTSLMVPSPPTAMIRSHPLPSASRVKLAACIGRSVKACAQSPSALCTACEMESKWRAVAPLAESGLTTRKGLIACSAFRLRAPAPPAPHRVLRHSAPRAGSAGASLRKPASEQGDYLTGAQSGGAGGAGGDDFALAQLGAAIEGELARHLGHGAREEARGAAAAGVDARARRFAEAVLQSCREERARRGQFLEVARERAGIVEDHAARQGLGTSLHRGQGARQVAGDVLRGAALGERFLHAPGAAGLEED